jgi:hypothetical protein
MTSLWFMVETITSRWRRASALPVETEMAAQT